MTFCPQPEDMSNNALHSDALNGDVNTAENSSQLVFSSDAMGDAAQSLGGKTCEGDSAPTSGLQRLLTGQWLSGTVGCSLEAAWYFRWHSRKASSHKWLGSRVPAQL